MFTNSFFLTFLFVIVVSCFDLPIFTKISFIIKIWMYAFREQEKK
jgi:hypothetical protein